MKFPELEEQVSIDFEGYDCKNVGRLGPGVVEELEPSNHRPQFACGSAESSLVRRSRDLRTLVGFMQKARLDASPLKTCTSIIRGDFIRPEITDFFSDLPPNERHYWIASLYACLIPQSKRQRLAAYFTPPHLAQYAIDRLRNAGVEPGLHRILDPASGGAAFLVPLAEGIFQKGKREGRSSTHLLQAVRNTLAGIEIEPDLAALSHSLLEDVAQSLFPRARFELSVPVTRGDALALAPPTTLFDAVIGNPPFGRVYRPSDKILSRFHDVISDGYVNVYSLFMQMALEWVKPGGIVCLILPMSFVGGAHFRSLRKHVLSNAHVLSLDQIAHRSDVFLDVLYDVGVLTMQRKPSIALTKKASSCLCQLTLHRVCSVV